MQVISQRSLAVYAGARHALTLMLFTTPLIAYSAVFLLFYIFVHGRTARYVDAPELPPYPVPETRPRLTLVLGELHHASTPTPVPNPAWLSIPERGLFTGIAVFGAIGTGKTTCCMRPFAEQLFAYQGLDPARSIGGLVLEVKGDFCHQVREVLATHGREDDYVEIALDGDYRYNPLENNLDADALAYALSSLIALNFGKGSDPFWSMASTNVVKFIILLHRLVDGYVTLFDVYHCAINSELLEAKIREGEALFASTRRVLLDPDTYVDDKRKLVIGRATDELRKILQQIPSLTTSKRPRSPRPSMRTNAPSSNPCVAGTFTTGCAFTTRSERQSSRGSRCSCRFSMTTGTASASSAHRRIAMTRRKTRRIPTAGTLAVGPFLPSPSSSRRARFAHSTSRSRSTPVSRKHSVLS